MILRSIRVENWRCLLQPIEVGPFEEHLNVLHAPNATGKSTLFEALCRGLLDSHRVSGKDVEAIRPWGRSVAPFVAIEFSHEGTDFRVTKRFLDNPHAFVERMENGRFVRLAEGNSADEKAREILTQNPPGRGLSRPENWGLAQILWAPQGDLAFGSLSGDLLTDIRSSLGAQISGPGAGDVEKRIQDVYAQFFTPGGKLRGGKDAPRIVQLREKLQSAQDSHVKAVSQQQDFEEAMRRVEDLQARRAQAKRDSANISGTLKKARSRAESYKALLSEKSQREERLKAAEAQYNELKQRIEAIQSTRSEIENTEKDLREVEAEMPLRVKEVEDREKEAAKAKADLENIRKERQQVDDAQEIAEKARRFLEDSRKIADLDERIKKILGAQEALAERKRERADLVAPDDKTLRTVRKEIKKRDDAQLRIEAALITLEVVAEKDGSLDVVAGEETGTVPLSPGSPVQVKGSPEVVADLAGVARLRAWGPTGSIDEHRKERDSAQQKIDKLTEPFGTDNLEELEALVEKAKELDRKIGEADTRLRTLLGEDTLEEIEQERSRINAVVERAYEERPDWRQTQPDAESLKSVADQTRRSFVEDVERAESRRDGAQSALTSANEQRTEISSRQEGTEKQLKSLKSRIATLTNDGRQDHEREEDLRKMALTWDAARCSFEETQKRLSEFGDDPTTEVERLEKQLDAADKAATKALEEEKSEEGRLAHLSAQGPYSNLARAAEEVENLKQEIKAEELRVAAIRLMYDTVTQCRAKAVAAVAGPVETEASRTLDRIGGRRLGRLRLGESFKPAHVVPDISGTSVSLESVSGGEREQIYLATRLALAKVLSRNERQLVVLDDVLTFTDTGRLARVMSILEEAAQQMQVLILTCHPERYGGLQQSHFVDLEAIVRQANE